ncbi:putative autophagy-related protein 27 [Elsinoe fawcettii]|nr:putative autophagy-related protein 27 [Elsinoe fawcettii]
MSPLSTSLLLALLPLVSAVNFNCDKTLVDNVHFDLSKLSGAHTVWNTVSSPSTERNTTFTIDLCKPLKGDDLGRGLVEKEQCPGGTRVCAVETAHDLVEDTTRIRVAAIAGDFAASHGRALDPKVTRLKGSASNSDNEKEGLRVELNGGKYPDTKAGRVQKAVVELVCDRERTGNEEVPGKEKREEKDGEDEGEKDKGKSLRFQSYQLEGEVEVLRLTWRTRYACEDSAEEEKGKAGGGWGFFTWFIVIVFLGAAGYIIFGSWLNYSRYGARGWDLVPHGDSLRDLPYILKDWVRNVVDTIQGRGYRGGYSAV